MNSTPKPNRQRYVYNISVNARHSLQSLVNEHMRPNRQQIYRRKQRYEFDGSVLVEITSPTTATGNGVSHLLNLTSQNYNVTDWHINPDAQITTKLVHTKFYIDPTSHQPLMDPIIQSHNYILLPEYDQQYAKECQADPTPWDDLSLEEQRSRQYNLNNKRDQYAYEFSLTPWARNYYAIFSTAKHIQLQSRRGTNTNNQTSLINAALEAIARGYFLFPEGALDLFHNTINLNMSHPLYGQKRAPKKFGNFDGTPWLAPAKGEPTWSNRLHNPALYNQDDVDFACTPKANMREQAIEAVALNPILILPPEQPTDTNKKGGTTWTVN